MDEKTQLKSLLKRFSCRRHLAVESLTVRLGDNLTEYIMTMYKPFIKDIKKRLWYLVYPNYTSKDRVYCVLQTMQSIDFLARAGKDLVNQGLPVDTTLLKSIDSYFYKLYKADQPNLIHIKTKSDDSRVIVLSSMKRYTMINPTQFIYFVQHRFNLG